jgi:hypothetical protein
VICLDSGAGNYDQLWLTTSLRGLVAGDLEVQVLDEGIHSGGYGGIAPSAFRILRHLIERLEDSKTGNLLPDGFHCPTPIPRRREAEMTARILGDDVWKKLPWACGADGGSVLPTTTDPREALLNSTWRPSLTVTGASGLPPLADAGNVLAPRTAFKLSLRLPPLVDAARAVVQLQRLLENDPPYNAKVTFKPEAGAATGWNATAFRQGRRVYRAGRHDSADEYAQGRLSTLAIHGVRRARSKIECARSERIPACAVCEEADGIGRRGDCSGAINVGRSLFALEARFVRAFFRPFSAILKKQTGKAS